MKEYVNEKGVKVIFLEEGKNGNLLYKFVYKGKESYYCYNKTDVERMLELNNYKEVK